MNRILKNENGFNLVQVLVGLGITGVISLALMSQMGNFQSANKKAEKKLEMDQFLDNIARTLAQKKVCDKNFLAKDISSLTLSELTMETASDPDKVFAQAGTDYLAGAITLSSIVVAPVAGSSSEFNLVITANKNREKKSYTSVTRNIRIAAEMDGTVVRGCYSSSTNVDDISSVCVGTGVVVDGDGNCQVKNFDPALYSDLNCDDGYSMRELRYEFDDGSGADAYTYSRADCRASFTAPAAACADNMIQSIAADGSMNCFDRTQRYSPDPVTFTAGQEYQLVLSNNKITLAQAGTAAACISTGCPDLATICSGVSAGVDNCSNSCGVGTKTDRLCAPACIPGCIDPSLVCVGTTVTPADGCGGTCNIVGTAPIDGPNCFMAADGGDGSSGGCFVAGVEISLFDGSKKNIESITKEDVLLGTNGAPVKILSLINFEHKGHKYSFNKSRFFVTGGHPFKTLEGWKAFDVEQAKKDNPDLSVGKLKVGDIIFTENGIERVEEYDRIYTEERVYNFHVDGINEYISNGYQVHNKIDPPSCASGWVLNCTYTGGSGYNWGTGKCNDGSTAECIDL